MGVVAAPVGLAAKLFRGFADPTRLQILLALQHRERRVTDLQAEVGGSQANISRASGLLEGMRLVVDRPQGRSTMTEPASPTLKPSKPSPAPHRSPAPPDSNAR